MEVKLCVLGSTSAGNSTVVWNKDNVLLIDCGFSPKYIQENFDNLGIDFSKLRGILLTHLHNDHLNLSFLKVAQKSGVPVYVQKRMKEFLDKRKDLFKQLIRDGLVKVFEEETFSLAGFEISAFEVPHDVPGGCWGYNLVYQNEVRAKKISLATDIGYPTVNTVNRFKDSDLIVIESNHDVTMLANSKRSNWLKSRIQNIGHLSNEQSADFIHEVLSQSVIKPKTIMLAHISQECNTQYLAATTMMNKLQTKNHSDVKVVLTHKNLASEVITI